MSRTLFSIAVLFLLNACCIAEANAEALFIQTRETLVVDNSATEGDLRRAQELGEYTLRLAPENNEVLPKLVAALNKYPPGRIEAELAMNSSEAKIRRLLEIKPDALRLISGEEVALKHFPALTIFGSRAVAVSAPNLPDDETLDGLKQNKVLLVGWEAAPIKIEKDFIKRLVALAKDKKLKLKLVIGEHLNPALAEQLAKLPAEIDFAYKTKDNKVQAEWLAFLKEEQKKPRNIEIIYESFLDRSIKEELEGFSRLNITIKVVYRKGVFPHLIDLLKEIGAPTRKPLKPKETPETEDKPRNEKSDRPSPPI
ncbi:MAG: hypothetical protein Kow0090_12940 [Myxococcota bacterium]